MHGIRQQIEVDLRNADAEQLTSTRIAEEKAAAAEAARREAELARRHRDPEPGTLPAVASAAQPVGVDSSAAAEVLEALANYFNTPEVKEVMSEADRIKTREEQIALIRRLRPDVTDYEAQELRNLYDQKTAGAVAVKAVTGAGELIKETGRRIVDDVKTAYEEHEATKDKYLPERGTIERSLADYVLSGYTQKVMGAVAASSVYHHVVAPVVNVVVDTGGELVKGVAKGMALRDAGLANAAYQFGGGPKPTFTPEQQLEHVDQAFEGMGKAVGTVVKPVVERVQSTLEFATGSKRAGELLTEPALMVATDGASRLITPALKTTGRLVRQGATALRNTGITFDSTAFLRHNAGIPIDAVKIGQKTPKVEAPTPAPTAPKVAEATVSEAPLKLVYEEAPYHTTRLRPGKSAAPTKGQALLEKSIPIKDTTARRVAVTDDGQIIVFDRTELRVTNNYHGHVVSWEVARQEIKNVLIRNGYFTSKGRFVKGSE